VPSSAAFGCQAVPGALVAEVLGAHMCVPQAQQADLALPASAPLRSHLTGFPPSKSLSLAAPRCRLLQDHAAGGGCDVDGGCCVPHSAD
jgi:hypothetical protein